MFRKILLPLLAVAGVVLAIYTVHQGQKETPAAPPVAPPSKSPFDRFISGAGIVEAQTGNIAIGVPVSQVVTRVMVVEGDEVHAHQQLLQLSDRTPQSELIVRKAALESAKAKLDKLLSQPRLEDKQAAEAVVAEAQANFDDLQSQYQNWLALRKKDERAVSEDELSRKRFAAKSADAKLQAAKAQLAQLTPWSHDIDIARSDVTSAQAAVDQTLDEIDRLKIKVPDAVPVATVLQVNARAGEFALAGVMNTPLLVLGRTDIMRVRVDVDENDAWKITHGARATGYLRGNSTLKVPLHFVRVDPYVIPKRSLTGDSTERVDTRVLQVIYEFKRADAKFNIYVGQQMDVNIEDLSDSETATAPSGQPTTNPSSNPSASPATQPAAAR